LLASASHKWLFWCLSAGAANAEKLFRVLRLAATYGMLKAEVAGDGRFLFQNNAYSALLTSDNPSMLTYFVGLPLFVQPKTSPLSITRH
jgi:hypothetical protein